MTAFRVYAVDPGCSESAYVRLDMTGKIFDRGKLENYEMLNRIEKDRGLPREVLAIEMIASYGMPVGREVFETCVWIGRFVERWAGNHTMVYRKDVKMHLCGQTRAKDANIRAALIDVYGGKGVALGTAKARGPLYGITGDQWAALAVAVTFRNSDHSHDKISQ